MGKQYSGCWISLPPHSCGTVASSVCADLSPHVLVCTITAVLPITQKRRPGERSSIPPHSSPSDSHHLLCSLSPDSMADLFPPVSTQVKCDLSPWPILPQAEHCFWLAGGESLSRKKRGVILFGFVS